MIAKWVFDKGIQVEEGMTYKQLVFLIARKIARVGTNYYQKGGTDLVDSVITDKRVEKILDRMRDVMITNTKEVLTKAYLANV